MPPSSHELGLAASGSRSDRPVRITPRGIRIGRDAQCAIPLRDPQASRQHAVAWRQSGQYFVRDEGSANGTWLNGERLAQPRELHAGDVLRIGQTPLNVVTVSGGQAIPLWIVGAAALVIFGVLYLATRPSSGATQIGAATATVRPTATAIATVPTVTPTSAPATATPSPLPATAAPTASAAQVLQTAQQATVQLRVQTPQGTSFGSGSIVDSRGLILTNFHVIGDSKTGSFYNAQKIAEVAITILPNGDAEWRYRAIPAAWDVDLDLAVLRITADLNGRPVSGLNLPRVLLGNSDTLQIGERIHTLGYPGIGGDSLTVTEGTVSGFVTEGDQRQWIKSDVDVTRGNSGGMAVAADGRMIGVPSAVMTDSTGGRTLGRLSYLRPINLAKPLIAKAAATLP